MEGDEMLTDKNKIYIVDDDESVRYALSLFLDSFGFEVQTFVSAIDFLSSISKDAPGYLILDVCMAGMNGFELQQKLKTDGFQLQTIFISADRNLGLSEQYLKETTSADFLQKPFTGQALVDLIQEKGCPPGTIKAASHDNIGSKSRFSSMGKLFHKKDTFHDLVGQSLPLADIYSMIERMAGSRATILLHGESGTGKRVIAKAIHKADKNRRDKPFMEISCGALPREIIESELFGHTKGAFTGAINERKGRFELANGGTVLLDDIDSFSLDLQVKLLRVLQHKEFERVGDNKTIKVDVRFIVSTNQDLKKAIVDKKFREDLYYRLNVISIDIPPLRKHKDDLSLLVSHFMNLYSEENHKKINKVSDDAIRILMNYNWPGNIRELENVIERAVILDTDGVITNDDLPKLLVDNTSEFFDMEVSDNMTGTVFLKDVLKGPERLHISRIIKEVGGNKNEAAKKLGVNRTTLYNKLKKYNLLEQAV
jgi:two-component system response regulator AtoC